MKILMLGWEFPPHISGGLGTACAGLTNALGRYSIDVTFALPHLYGGERASFVRLVDVVRGVTVEHGGDAYAPPASAEDLAALLHDDGTPSFSAYTKSLGVGAEFQELLATAQSTEHYALLRQQVIMRAQVLARQFAQNGHGPRYGGDMFSEVDRFAAHAVLRFAEAEFDVIHVHDWMTVPAGVALRALTNRPLVFHVHSLEFDRSGSARNGRIHEIEGLGVHTADRVVAVSHYTANVIRQEHGVGSGKIVVVHNGIYPSNVVQSYRRGRGVTSKIVLFLGRVTFQKGPDYFVEAAARVIPHVPDVHFVVAGAGDMLPRLQERVRQLDVEAHFSFPGFLRGREVEEMFSMADLYVMPSVSEPFGISALEAIQFDTPVIMSKQSGVAEVISHALKVDFWDVERLADMMVNMLVHPELPNDMLQMAREELRRIRWEAAALKMIEVYRGLLSRQAKSVFA